MPQSLQKMEAKLPTRCTMTCSILYQGTSTITTIFPYLKKKVYGKYSQYPNVIK